MCCWRPACREAGLVGRILVSIRSKLRCWRSEEAGIGKGLRGENPLASPFPAGTRLIKAQRFRGPIPPRMEPKDKDCRTTWCLSECEDGVGCELAERKGWYKTERVWGQYVEKGCNNPWSQPQINQSATVTARHTVEADVNVDVLDTKRERVALEAEHTSRETAVGRTLPPSPSDRPRVEWNSQGARESECYWRPDCPEADSVDRMLKVGSH